MRYLLEFIRLVLLGLIELDRRIFPLFDSPVRLWSEWTGKSNFTLSRILVLVGFLLCVGGAMRFFFLFSGGLHPEKTSTTALLFLTFVVLVTLLRTAYEIEKLVEEADGEVLSRKLYVEEVFHSVWRPFGVLLYPFVIWAFVEEDTILNIFTFLAMLLIIVTLYTLFHYNHGGKSKVREIIRQVVTQLSFSPIPSPVPVPSR